MTTAYPLHWPAGTPRTASRTRSKFSTTIAGAVKNVMDELRRFGNDSGKRVEDIVISSNVSLAETRPSDPGIAVYFRWEKIDCCISIDRYQKTEENLQAVARVIEAERTKLRHGGLNIVRTSFRGYAHLPPPKGADGQLAAPWWQVLGFTNLPSLTSAEVAYRDLVKKHHPDAGGDAAKFNQITDAIRAARIELSRAA
ncbi:MAG: J domain-containing protein [Rhodopseudomonas sp.]|nr:J domain-containing protein [Rhodopseudomonas sp.]